MASPYRGTETCIVCHNDFTDFPLFSCGHHNVCDYCFTQLPQVDWPLQGLFTLRGVPLNGHTNYLPNNLHPQLTSCCPYCRAIPFFIVPGVRIKTPFDPPPPEVIDLTVDIVDLTTDYN
jgi:hypothetical protein